MKYIVLSDLCSREALTNAMRSIDDDWHYLAEQDCKEITQEQKEDPETVLLIEHGCDSETISKALALGAINLGIVNDNGDISAITGIVRPIRQKKLMMASDEGLKMLAEHYSSWVMHYEHIRNYTGRVSDEEITVFEMDPEAMHLLVEILGHKGKVSIKCISRRGPIYIDGRASDRLAEVEYREQQIKKFAKLMQQVSK